MHTTLDFPKLLQASGIFLKHNRLRMKHISLLKLLYIADRCSLKETGRTIVGGKVVAMKNGPLHSEVLNMINNDHWKAATWATYFRKVDTHFLEQIEDPGTGALSRPEIALLQRVATEFEDYSEWQLVDYTHTFPEWMAHSDVGTSSAPIHLEEMLDALELQDCKAEVIADLKELNELDRLMGFSN